MQRAPASLSEPQIPMIKMMDYDILPWREMCANIRGGLRTVSLRLFMIRQGMKPLDITITNRSNRCLTNRFFPCIF